MPSGGERLASALCPAPIVEPGLLRAVRRLLLPALHAGAEGEFWFGPHIETRGPAGATFRPEASRRLRQNLLTGESGFDSETLRKVRGVMRRLHGHAAPALRAEEDGVWAAILGDVHEFEAHFEQMRATLTAAGTSEAANWALRLHGRLPDEFQQLRPAQRLHDAALELAEFADVGWGSQSVGEILEKFDDVELPVAAKSDRIVLGIDSPHATARLLVPDTRSKRIDIQTEESWPSWITTWVKPNRQEDIRAPRGAAFLRDWRGRIFALGNPTWHCGPIYVSYQRGGSSAEASRLSRSMQLDFAAESVLGDVSLTSAGESLSALAIEEISKSAAVIVMVGWDWEANSARPGVRARVAPDFVGSEVETAVALDKKILPVLVNRTTVPAPLRRIATLESVQLSKNQWEVGVQNLVAALRDRAGDDERFDSALSPRRAPDTREVLEPNPREVSRRVLAPLSSRTPWLGELQKVHSEAGGRFVLDSYLGRAPMPIANLLLPAWINFVTADWTAGALPPNPQTSRLQIPLTSDDDWPEDSMHVRRLVSPYSLGSWSAQRNGGYRWAGAQLYGLSHEHESRLRQGMSGKIRVDGARGWWLGMDSGASPGEGASARGNGYGWLGPSLLHSLFALEHNHLCDQFRVRHPDWDDDRLFNTAREITVAMIAKIHTMEWMSALFPHPSVGRAMKRLWDEAVRARGAGFSRVLRRYGSLVRVSVPGVPTEADFTALVPIEVLAAVCRMHTLLPDEVVVRRGENEVAYQLSEVIGSSQRAIGNHDPAELWLSFGNTLSGALRLHNYSDALRRRVQPLADGAVEVVDYATEDIVRDRDTAPRYTECCRRLGLPYPETFLAADGEGPAITDDPVWAHELEQLYGTPDRVDLNVGLYAAPLVEGYGLPVLGWRILASATSRLLSNSGLLTNANRAEVDTQFGMRWVKESSLADVICRHFPELSQILADVNNAFAPWHPSTVPARE